jgi:hypothetical protein
MSAQEGGPKRNFIAILSDEVEPRRTIEQPEKSAPFARDYFIGLIRAVLGRRGRRQ